MRSSGLIPGRDRKFLYPPKHPNPLWNQKYSYCMGSWLFAGGQRPGPQANHSSPPNGELRMDGTISPFTLCTFTMCKRTTLIYLLACQFESNLLHICSARKRFRKELWKKSEIHRPYVIWCSLSK